MNRCSECGSPDPAIPCDYCEDVARQDSEPHLLTDEKIAEQERRE